MEEEPLQNTPLREAREEFVSQWGAIGSCWGINRTMAQVHALLMTSPVALSTDEIMAELKISRGNANTNLRELVGWGLIRVILRKGDRKEYFEAEKEVWKIFCTVAKERKRRELVPAMEVLQRCATQTKGVEGAEVFHRQMAELLEFLRLAEKVLDTVASSKQGKIMKMAARLFAG